MSETAAPYSVRILPDEQKEQQPDLAQLGASMAGALEKLVRFAGGHACEHEDTHRAGAIWTVCNSCGRKWADGEGSPEPFIPEGLEEGIQALAAYRAALASQVTNEQPQLQKGEPAADQLVTVAHAVWVPGESRARLLFNSDEAALDAKARFAGAYHSAKVVGLSLPSSMFQELMAPASDAPLEELLSNLAALYEDDDECRLLPEYIAAQSALATPSDAEGLRIALAGLVALYEADEGSTSVPQYVAAKAVLA